MAAIDTLILIIFLWGFFSGRILPLSFTAWKKWLYNRRGIPYFLIYIIQAGKIVHKGMCKQNQVSFTYDKGRYITFKKDVDLRAYSPAVEMGGQQILFYNKNNTNPLEFQETRVTPSHNDPEIFKTIIEDNSIRQALSGEFDVSELKRYMLIVMGILGLAIAGIMYYLTKM